MSEKERLILYADRVERRMEVIKHLHAATTQALIDAESDLSTLKAELGLAGGQPELIQDAPPGAPPAHPMIGDHTLSDMPVKADQDHSGRT